jgi:hypothetical protein
MNELEITWKDGMAPESVWSKLKNYFFPCSLFFIRIWLHSNQKNQIAFHLNFPLWESGPKLNSSYSLLLSNDGNVAALRAVLVNTRPLSTVEPMAIVLNFPISNWNIWSCDSVVYIANGYGIYDQGVGVPVLVGPEVHPTSYPIGNGGSFPGGWAAEAWRWPLNSS